MVNRACVLGLAARLLGGALIVSCLFSIPATSLAEPVRVRIVAANLSSGSKQSYSADNSNHSNIEGAGARILKALQPDVVLIQELNVGDGSMTSLRSWVNQTFGADFDVAREDGKGIPNGVLSRYPIIAAGEWDDKTQSNRDFFWAKMKLPNGRNLWAVSVHFYSKKPSVRNDQARAVLSFVEKQIPKEDLVVLGGDFNTDRRDETCISSLSSVFKTDGPPPVDNLGNDATNEPRGKPYDWVLADTELNAFKSPMKIGAVEYKDGFVFDSRVYEPLSEVAPVQKDDSARKTGMQHMAVAKEFVVPD